MKSQPHLKGIVAGRAMKGFVVSMLNIGEIVIPCVSMFGVVHAQDMHSHPFDDLGLAIWLGVQGSGFGDLVVQ